MVCLKQKSLNFPFVGDGLYYASNGQLYLYWDQIHDYVCKSRIYWYFVSEGFTYWTIVALSIERVLVLYFPLQTRFQITTTRTKFVLVTIAALSCAQMWSVWITQKISPNKAFKNGIGCVQSTENSRILASYLTFVINYGTTLYPSIIAIIISLILLKKVLNLAQERNQLINRDTSKGSELSHSQKEITTCMVVIGIDVLHFLIYFPTQLAWSGYSLLDDITVRLSMLSIARFLSSMNIITHFWNLYVYCFFIKEFRTECYKLICCVNSVKTKIHSDTSR